ncbi:MAG: proline dehydrogenase family protein [Thiolinea sp.]
MSSTMNSSACTAWVNPCMNRCASTRFPAAFYAPVRVHQDLLAYLVQRLLENGANASFVSQLLDNRIPPQEVVADPLAKGRTMAAATHARCPHPGHPVPAGTRNSQGYDWLDPQTLEELEAMRALGGSSSGRPIRCWNTLTPPRPPGEGPVRKLIRPARCTIRPGIQVGTSPKPASRTIEAAFQAARAAQRMVCRGVQERARILNQAADLYEQHAGELFALITREAGKTIRDAIAELREAVDFLRYYAAQAGHLPPAASACGVMACISPWNFPLAIFTGQLSAALAAGNAVLVKPAEAPT